MGATKSKAIAGLRALAEHNNGERERLVTTLVKATGRDRAIRVNRERQTNNRGGN